MTQNVKIKVFYPHPPERVWQVLTNRRALAAWLMDNDFEPRLGHRFQFESESLPGLKTTIHCQVIALDEPKRLVYTWQDLSHPPSIVTWTLEAVAGGTQLRLEHQGSHNVIKLNQSEQLSHSWQGHIQPSMMATQMLQPVERLTNLGFENFDSFSLGGGWEYRLNHRLSQILIPSATSNHHD